MGYDDDGYSRDPDRLDGLYVGTVVRVENDPDDPNAETLPRMGRLKFVIPGLIEPESVWALPFGAGGSPAWGRNVIPPKGADVYVMFINGDPDQPVWAPGWHADGEAFPEFVDPRMQVFGFGPFRVVLDNRADPARVQGTVSEPFSGVDGLTLTVAVNLATAESVTLQDAETAAEIASRISAGMTRARAYALNGAVVVESNFTGASTSMQVGGSAASVLGLSTSQVRGSGARQATIKTVRDVMGTAEDLCEIVMDADLNGVRIFGTTTVAIESNGLVSIKGEQVQIKERIVMPSTKPIN